MSALSYQTIKALGIINPWNERTEWETPSGQKYTYGCGPAGYDIRLAEFREVRFGKLVLASSIERFTMPNNVIGRVHDKSTWVRRGLTVQNTVIEPGWKGYLTLELTYNEDWGSIKILPGSPIAQVVFDFLDEPTEKPYTGKYQDQKPGPQSAR